MDIKKFKIEGMSCAACSSRVERAVSALDGVEECSVNLLLGSMSVRGDVSEGDILCAVERAGYGISPDGASSAKKENEDIFKKEKEEMLRLAKRLVASSSLLILLMYVSMGHVMWGAPLPHFVEGNFVALGLIELAISAAILVINKHFFINGVKGMVKLSPNMDSLVAVGSSASFIYSVCLLFIMTANVSEGVGASAMEILHGLYFEAAAMIPTLITVGKLLEAVAKGRTTNAIKDLMLLAPASVVIERDGEEVTVLTEELTVGDVMVIRQGESIAADGEVIFGDGSVNESMLTGESMPADKSLCSQVYCGTVLVSGYLRVRVTEIGENTVLSDIVRTVKDASSSKAPVAKIADKVSGVFVPVVMGLALLTALIWLICGADAGDAVARGTAVLVISCPCALGLATPVAVMVGSGVGAKHGILFKTAAGLELCGRIKTVVFDKTGTVTQGKPTVNGIFPIESDAYEIICKAYALEKMSEHPLAGAIVDYAESRGDLEILSAEGFVAEAGGIRAEIDGKSVFVGNYGFTVKNLGYDIPELSEALNMLSERGNTPLTVCEKNRILGIISLADEVKPESEFAVSEIKKLGIRTVMLTGDNTACAAAIAKKVGIEDFRAEVLPKDKARLVKEFSENGAVIMVGDGINDAPALTAADVGMAIGAGAHIAIESAEVVLMSGRLTSVTDAIRLGKRTLRTIYLNLFWAFCYNIVGIPLAAGAFASWLGWTLSPMFGALAMSLSSFLVVTGSLTVNLFKPIDKITKNAINVNNSMKKSYALNIETANTDEICFEKIRRLCEKTKSNDCLGKENLNMTNKITVRIEGMMCPHCSGRVKSLLEALESVVSADVSHERGDAILELREGYDISLIEKTVTDAGYKVVG